MKLVVAEPETSALERDLVKRTGLLTSRLGAAEVRRAAQRDGRRRLLAHVDDVLDAFVIVEVTPAIVNRAALLTPAALRTLDAIHLATAEALDLTPLEFISYDDTLSRAAMSHGLRVCQPR